MDIALVVILIVAGVVLLLLELFLLPGFGIAGITGFLSLAGAVAAAYLRISATAGHITLAAAVAAAALAVYGFIRSHALQKMALDTSIESKVKLAAPGKKIENLERDAKEMDAERKKEREEKATANAEDVGEPQL
mgnify:CR=1 FL=1